MTPERWQQITALLSAVHELPSGEQQAYLDRHCPDDPDMRREVLSLLEASDLAGNFLEEPAQEYVASLKLPARASSEGPSIGEEIEGYRILGYLGGGGMGSVHKAYDPKNDRIVVLKFLLPRLRADEIARKRFIHEAKTASAIKHNNICVIHEISQTKDGKLFIVMPYYEGQTLKEKIAQGPLPLEKALDIATQILCGLTKVHAKDIKHRDIKPANVMVTKDGVVKILDFGIAKAMDVNLTKTGTTVGTPAYMSPEQVRGEQVDNRTDIWSTGVLLYEMLAGARPFEGESDALVHLAILNQQPKPLTRLRGDLQRECEDIVRTSLEKKRDHRYKDAEAMLAALEGLRGRQAAADTEPMSTPGWGTTLLEGVKTLLEGVKTFVRRRIVWLGVVVVLMLAIASYFMLPLVEGEGVSPSDQPEETSELASDFRGDSSISPTGVNTAGTSQDSLANGATDDSLVVSLVGTKESPDDPPPEVVPGSLNITSIPEGASIIRPYTE